MWNKYDTNESNRQHHQKGWIYKDSVESWKRILKKETTKSENILNLWNDLQTGKIVYRIWRIAKYHVENRTFHVKQSAVPNEDSIESMGNGKDNSVRGLSRVT